MARTLKKTIRSATTRSPVLTAAIRLSSGSTEEIGWSRSTAQIASRIAVAIIVGSPDDNRSEEHTSELQSLRHLVCRLLLEKKKKVQGRTLRRWSQIDGDRE